MRLSAATVCALAGTVFVPQLPPSFTGTSGGDFLHPHGGVSVGSSRMSAGFFPVDHEGSKGLGQPGAFFLCISHGRSVQRRRRRVAGNVRPVLPSTNT
jgi:hypothetical protein